MINKAKLVLIAALTVTRFAATPAFGQSFDEDDGTGNALRFSYRQTAPDKAASHHAPVHAARRNGMNSFAMEPRAKSGSNSNPYNASRVPPFDPRGTSDYPWGPGYNFPYPDRPYGDPDHW
jgi:hypothetical protein